MQTLHFREMDWNQNSKKKTKRKRQCVCLWGAPGSSSRSDPVISPAAIVMELQIVKMNNWLVPRDPLHQEWNETCRPSEEHTYISRNAEFYRPFAFQEREREEANYSNVNQQ